MASATRGHACRTPDVREYSYRDYGNRAGFWRMTEVLDAYQIKCCVSLNWLSNIIPRLARRWSARLGFHESRHL